MYYRYYICSFIFFLVMRSFPTAFIEIYKVDLFCFACCLFLFGVGNFTVIIEFSLQILLSVKDSSAETHVS